MSSSLSSLIAHPNAQANGPFNFILPLYSLLCSEDNRTTAYFWCSWERRPGHNVLTRCYGNFVLLDLSLKPCECLKISLSILYTIHSFLHNATKVPFCLLFLCLELAHSLNHQALLISGKSSCVPC